MQFFVNLLLPFVVCVGLVVATAVVWWNRLQSPWTYLGLSILMLLGIHRVVQVGVAIVSPIIWSSDYFLEARKDPARFWELSAQSLTVEAIVVSTLMVAIGLPVLRSLRTLLAKV